MMFKTYTDHYIDLATISFKNNIPNIGGREIYNIVYLWADIMNIEYNIVNEYIGAYNYSIEHYNKTKKSLGFYINDMLARNSLNIYDNILEIMVLEFNGRRYCVKGATLIKLIMDYKNDMSMKLAGYSYDELLNKLGYDIDGDDGGQQIHLKVTYIQPGSDLDLSEMLLFLDRYESVDVEILYKLKTVADMFIF